jgi:hypothetical protein
MEDPFFRRGIGAENGFEDRNGKFLRFDSSPDYSRSPLIAPEFGSGLSVV